MFIRAADAKISGISPEKVFNRVGSGALVAPWIFAGFSL
jgi:hypothetical protein